MSAFELLVFAPGTEAPSAVDRQIRQIFASEYHAYHYMEQVIDRSRLRCLAVEEGGVGAWGDQAGR